MEAWCILRTSGARTLNLASSLAKDGFDVWTPVEKAQVRGRRSHPPSESTVALMPSYVFARMDRIDELLALSRSPSLTYRRWDQELRRMVLQGHPAFSVMKGMDNAAAFAEVPDRQLSALRMIETRRAPKPEVREAKRGDRVRLTEESYAGLHGTVVSVGCAFHEVLLDGWVRPLKIARYLAHLEIDESHADGVSNASTVQALTAEAA